MSSKTFAILLQYIFVFGQYTKPLYCAPNYIDLTYPFENGFTQTWPINKPFNFSIITRGPAGEFPYLENNEFYMVSDQTIANNIFAVALFINHMCTCRIKHTIQVYFDFT